MVEDALTYDDNNINNTLFLAFITFSKTSKKFSPSKKCQAKMYYQFLLLLSSLNFTTTPTNKRQNLLQKKTVSTRRF